MSTVTCRTEGCSAADRPVQLDTTFADDETGETKTVDAVVCGACGQEINDITA